MRKLLTTVAIGLGLAGATLATTGPAIARDSQPVITFSFGDVAFGYRDGYWDHQRHWHKWRRASDRRDYRQAPTGEYHEWYHTRDRHNQGWHGDNDHRG